MYLLNYRSLAQLTQVMDEYRNAKTRDPNEVGFHDHIHACLTNCQAVILVVKLKDLAEKRTKALRRKDLSEFCLIQFSSKLEKIVLFNNVFVLHKQLKIFTHFRWNRERGSRTEDVDSSAQFRAHHDRAGPGALSQLHGAAAELEPAGHNWVQLKGAQRLEDLLEIPQGMRDCARHEHARLQEDRSARPRRVRPLLANYDSQQ